MEKIFTTLTKVKTECTLMRMRYNLTDDQKSQNKKNFNTEMEQVDH